MTLKEVLTFQKAKEAAFQKFFFKQDLKICRAAIFLVITIMMVLVIIDYFRINDFNWVLSARIIVVTGLSVLLVITYQKKVSANQLQLWLMVINATLVASFFFMDAATIMPPFYLPNSLVVYFFISGTVSGARFRYSSVFNFLVVLLFIFYYPISFNTVFHHSQIPNIVIAFVVSLLISFMWEWYKRVNFLQQTQLNNLINIFSHDMASPLNSLLGLLSLRDDNLLDKTEFTKHQENIKKSIHNNILLLQNLVKWSKSQMDGFKPNLESIDVSLILQEAISLLQQTAKEKNIQIQTQVESNSHCLADQEMTKLILRNTLSNAIKFSHSNSVVEVASVHENNSLIISIKDQGVGMSQEEMDRLFTMTVQSQPGTENERGAGIGLYITHEFIKLNKGKIKIHSQKGMGSTVHIILPKHI